MIYVVPAIALLAFVLAAIKKVSVYDSFIAGTREAAALTVSLIPYLAAVYMLMELMRLSGLSEYIGKLLSPLFKLLGLPIELSELIILRPLTGSGSLAVLENIYAQYGVDSYISRVASVIMGSTDTVMYVAAVYFSGVGAVGKKDISVSGATDLSRISHKRSMNTAVAAALFSSLVGAVVSALICRVL